MITATRSTIRVRCSNADDYGTHVHMDMLEPMPLEIMALLVDRDLVCLCGRGLILTRVEPGEVTR